MTGAVLRDQDLVAITLLCLAIASATVVFVSWPQIDLGVVRLFVDDDSRFWLADDPLLLFFNELIDVLGLGLVLIALAGLCHTRARRRPLAGLSSRAYGFLLAAVAIGPGLVANVVFKNEWGRARPRQLLEFGGSADFTPALIVADQCATNCSFVAGDASLAFTTLTLALLAPPRRRAGWIALAVLFGVFIGAVRVVQGAHFPSDVVFAGLFVALTVIVLKAMIMNGRFGAAALGRMLAPSARRVEAALRSTATATIVSAQALAPEPVRRRLAAPATREFWLRTFPGLKDFGLDDR